MISEQTLRKEMGEIMGTTFDNARIKFGSSPFSMGFSGTVVYPDLDITKLSGADLSHPMVRMHFEGAAKEFVKAGCG